jgi:signal transduction histidine kinase/DNA-binding response OmpR family regulator
LSDNGNNIGREPEFSMHWFFDYVSQKNKSIAAIFDADTFDVEIISDNTEEIIGIPKEELLKDISLLFVNTKDAKTEFTPTKEDLLKLGIGETMTLDVIDAVNSITGEHIYFEASLERQIIDGRDRFLLVWVDKTEEVIRNQQMEDMIDVANAANEAKTNFLANMSHDFRTPMNAITNFNLLIAKNSDNPQRVRDYTHKIGLACQNLLRLLNDVLDMSKIESGATKINQQEFALGLLLEEVNSVIAFQAKAKQQDYQVHAGGMRQDLFMGDKQKINEVLVNILGNAVKYTHVGGRIDFTISEEKVSTGDYYDVKFEVKDNGIGMSKEFQKNIFDAFTREEKKEVSGIQGTGLGMAITKSLVQMMGGTISVESNEGEGSTFIITLRLPGVNQDQGDFWENHGIRRILVIDDDIQECEKINTALQDTTVEVFFSTSGYKAMHLIEVSYEDESGFDVIILGMQIRSISCFELAGRIREKDLRPQPVLLLLTEDWEDVAQEARDAGIYDFITKPFFMSTFQQLIEDITNRPSASGDKKKSNPLEGIQILAAEDNEINADILVELMSMEGASIARVPDGKKAIEVFEKSEAGYYDVILMDVQMPVMNGYEAAGKIRELNREDAAKIPIIAMTANTYADDVQKSLDAGMDAHVSKPIDIEVLKTTILELLEKRRST